MFRKYYCFVRILIDKKNIIEIIDLFETFDIHFDWICQVCAVL